MTEHVNICDEPFITYRWREAWYKIPFFVLEDLCHEWGNNYYIAENARRHGHDVSAMDLETGPSRELREWLDKYSNHKNLKYGYFNERFTYVPVNGKQCIAEFKDIMKDQLDQMEAYRCY